MNDDLFSAHFLVRKMQASSSICLGSSLTDSARKMDMANGCMASYTRWKVRRPAPTAAFQAKDGKGTTRT